MKSFNLFASLTAATLLLAAMPADAARGRLNWSGSVDNVTEVYVQENHVRMQSPHGKAVDDVHYYFSRPLPLTRTRVRVKPILGRGRLWVFQQPSARNDFTAGVRIIDPRSGRGRYSFDLVW